MYKTEDKRGRKAHHSPCKPHSHTEKDHTLAHVSRIHTQKKGTRKENEGERNQKAS